MSIFVFESSLTVRKIARAVSLAHAPAPLRVQKVSEQSVGLRAGQSNAIHLAAGTDCTAIVFLMRLIAPQVSSSSSQLIVANRRSLSPVPPHSTMLVLLNSTVRSVSTVCSHDMPCQYVSAP
eukprot:1737858-Rhodomonas_salina.1